MASSSETGHAKNVANFENLITVCKGFGADYNPTRATIAIPALTALLENAQNTLKTFKPIETAYNNATNAREIAFEPLKKLSTQVMNALKGTGAMQQTVNDANTHHLKIQGRRASAKKTPTPASDTKNQQQPKTISTSQLSFDSLVENFASLIETLKAEPLYIPNEANLQVTSLSALLGDLTAKNKAVGIAETDYDNALINRNKVLYAPETGLYATTLAVKAYVKSVYPVGTAQLKQLTSLKFTNL